MSHLYILENKIPVLVEDTETWGRWFEDFSNRRVAFTELKDKQVSTVFLGVDHQWRTGGKPLLFETMVFESDQLIDRYCMRYSTWEEAEAGHYAVVTLIKVGSDRTQ